MKNKILGLLFIIIVMYIFIGNLIEFEIFNRLLYIGSMIIGLLGILIFSGIFGYAKVHSIKIFIFFGWFIVNLLISRFIGFYIADPIANGSIFGIVIGLMGTGVFQLNKFNSR